MGGSVPAGTLRTRVRTCVIVLPGWFFAGDDFAINAEVFLQEHCGKVAT
jgi:hypothetical protein